VSSPGISRASGAYLARYFSNKWLYSGGMSFFRFPQWRYLDPNHVQAEVQIVAKFTAWPLCLFEPPVRSTPDSERQRAAAAVYATALGLGWCDAVSPSMSALHRP